MKRGKKLSVYHDDTPFEEGDVVIALERFLVGSKYTIHKGETGTIVLSGEVPYVVCHKPHPFMDDNRFALRNSFKPMKVFGKVTKEGIVLAGTMEHIVTKKREYEKNIPIFWRIKYGDHS